MPDAEDTNLTPANEGDWAAKKVTPNFNREDKKEIFGDADPNEMTGSFPMISTDHPEPDLSKLNLKSPEQEKSDDQA